MSAILLAMALAAPRATGLDVPTSQSIDNLHQCIGHAACGTEDKDLPNGVAMTIGSTTNLLGMHKTGPLTFALTDSGELRHITVLYRHPLSAGGAAKSLRIYGRKCFPYELNAAGLEKAEVAGRR